MGIALSILNTLGNEINVEVVDLLSFICSQSGDLPIITTGSWLYEKQLKPHS